jgi:hypothetical protein
MSMPGFSVHLTASAQRVDVSRAVYAVFHDDDGAWLLVKGDGGNLGTFGARLCAPCEGDRCPVDGCDNHRSRRDGPWGGCEAFSRTVETRYGPESQQCGANPARWHAASRSYLCEKDWPEPVAAVPS